MILDNEGTAQESSPHLNLRFTRQQTTYIFSLVVRNDITMGHRLVLINEIAISHDHICACLLGTGHITANGILLQIVVLIDIEEIVTGGIFHTCTTRSSQSTVLLVVDNLQGGLAVREFLHHLLHDLDTAILGAVIDKDILYVVIGLSKKRTGAIRNIFLAPIDWYTDRYLDIFHLTHYFFFRRVLSYREPMINTNVNIRCSIRYLMMAEEHPSGWKYFPKFL